MNRTAIHRLESSQASNPTMLTLMRYAAALGKRIIWSLGDAPGWRGEASGGLVRQSEAISCARSLSRNTDCAGSAEEDLLIVYAEAFAKEADPEDFSLTAILAHERGHQILARHL